MPPSVLLLLVAVAGAATMGVSTLVLRIAGARPVLARRLAGPRGVKVGLLADTASTGRPVRVAGRIRCRDPLVVEEERLVAYHRDVEVRIGGRWRPVERLRETRSFELWDHDGSVTIDPARAAEPLVAIPTVWRGSPDELREPHTSGVARLVERHGAATEARAVTRKIDVTDRLLVLGRPVVEAGRMRLEPPPGGFVISTLELDDAMRLLGGPHRRAVATAVIGIAIGVAAFVVGIVGWTAVAVLGV